MKKDTAAQGKRPRSANLFAGLSSVAAEQMAKDAQREVTAAAPRATMVLPVLDMLPPYNGSLRPHLISHVVDLAVSIAYFDLIQSITLDSKRRMVAGRQRRAAIICLCYVADPEAYGTAFKELWPDDLAGANSAIDLQLRSETIDAPVLPAVLAWYAANRGSVPVRLLPFDSEIATDRARISEVIENEKRKRFTQDQIRAFAQELRERGYRDVPGRPKAGEKSLKVALSTILGVSYSSVRRYLVPDDAPAPAKPSVVTQRRAKAVSKSISDYLLEPSLPADIRTALEKVLAHAQSKPAPTRG